MRVPWTARRSNQSILKEISPGCSLEGMMLKLKLQYFGHLMRRVDSLKKNSDAGRDRGQEEKGKTEEPDVLQSMGSQSVCHDVATEQQQKQEKITTF